MRLKLGTAPDATNSNGGQGGYKSHQNAIKPHKDMRWVAAGVLAMALGGIISATFWMQSMQAVPVVKVVHDIPQGEIIKATDLAIVNIQLVPEIKTVPAAQLDGLIGKTTQTNLSANTLLGPADLSEKTVQPGTVQMGLALAEGRLPSDGVPAGARVKLYTVTIAQNTDTEAFSVDAIVVRGSQRSNDGGWVIDVAVPENVADAVAQKAAANQIVLARTAQK